MKILVCSKYVLVVILIVLLLLNVGCDKTSPAKDDPTTQEQTTSTAPDTLNTTQPIEGELSIIEDTNNKSGVFIPLDD